MKVILPLIFAVGKSWFLGESLPRKSENVQEILQLRADQAFRDIIAEHRAHVKAG
jgi:hypothetical protein